ncbi:hypothetical protein [Rugosimonospora africana]|uniref:Transmembrane protein n=1 Tax=Rugosimonospora africana TaxID=556532 RepID=A0A8J3QMR2_9ACTN|nr:hypothetical protein Raf01_07320 [Rugosimonospora africana]
MPTSVLLAVLAAAGLLALAPALVRRYDATERLVAERAMSTARVIERQRRRRTVPGRRPVNAPRSVASTAGVGPADPVAATLGSSAPADAAPAQGPATPAGPVSASPVSAIPAPRRSGRPAQRRGSLPPPRRRPKVHAHTPAIYRRRRVLAALVMLNASELCGVGLVGPGFWVGSAPSLMLLAAYVVHLRKRALEERRKRREAARRAAWIAARQAELRREQARRLAARREALRRAAAARAVAQRESLRLSQRYVDGSARGPLRGRAYEARAAGY